MYVQQSRMSKITKNSYSESASLWARILGHIVLCVEQLFCYFEFNLKGNDKREKVYKIKRRSPDPNRVPGSGSELKEKTGSGSEPFLNLKSFVTSI